MPDKANEQLPSSSDTAGTEAAGQTVAGSPALASGEDPMVEEQAARADFERAIRDECAGIAAAEYDYWKSLPVTGPESHVFDMQIAAMGAAANVCAAIMMGKSAKDHERQVRSRPAPQASTEGDGMAKAPRADAEAEGSVKSPEFSEEVTLAEMVVSYFGDDEIPAILNADIALRDAARALIAKARGEQHAG